MKQIKIIFIILLLILTANANWKPLKSLDHYGPKAFTLKEGVAYVEIRKYTESDGLKEDPVTHGVTLTKTMKKKVIFKIYRYPLSYFGSTVKRTFQHIPGKNKFAFKKGEYGGFAGTGSRWYYNGFMLDSKEKAWRLENIQDVIDMVKPVDTPADLSLVLWLHSDAQDRSDKESYSAKYRKSGSGYVIREHHVAHGVGDWVYGCGDYTFEYKINTSGKVIQKKLIRKRKVECGGD